MAACALVALLAPQSAGAELSLEPVGEYEAPTYVTSDPNNAERLFIVEKAGRVRLTAAGRTSTFLDQRAITNTEGWERGLLSMAFAPDFAETRLFYVFYTSYPDGSLRVDELLADGDVADPDSRRNVLTVPHPQEMHNGGQLQFGPDGYLYISIGDGGPEERQHRNGQDPTNLLGALLRIDPRQSGGDPYAIPADNPYVGTENAPEIWSWGLRNPWRFSFDRETGALTIGDVGTYRREEINYRPQLVGGGRGDNFGWDCREGFVSALEEPQCEEADPGEFIDPVFDYPNSGGNVTEEELSGPREFYCAIIGGYVVRDPALTELDGRYLYIDLCAGQLRSIGLDVPLAYDDCSEGLTVRSPSSFGEDAEGGIYVVSLDGAVSRVVGESERRDCVEVEGPPTVEGDLLASRAARPVTTVGKVPLTFALLSAGATVLMAGALILFLPWPVLENLGPVGRRRLRTAGAVIVAAGIAAAAVAILAEDLGLSPEASRGTFGWKRITLLIAGGVVAAVGALVLARPRIASRRLTSRRPSDPA